MSADYREQYRPDQLEPFFPHEIMKMTVAVLCTLAVIMFFAILPVLLEAVGVHGSHHEEPANPQGATPVGIKPEWYFLSVYQYLRLMPPTLLGISGKTLGVLSQGPLVLAVILLPFWYRKRAHERPRWLYRLIITAIVFAFLSLTIWGGWKEDMSGGEEHLVPISQYMRESPMIFLLIAMGLLVFYLLIAQERRAIRRILDEPAAPEQPEDRR
jgi:quinol-cytochrome oxidoreductase complex cytochrome b subunit